MQNPLVAIIGAGPIGLELAIGLKTAGISYIQFEAEQVAQMICNFPPQTHFFSSSERIGIAGIPIQTLDQQKCSRETYLAYIRAVVLHFGLHVHTGEEVVTTAHQEQGFHLTTRVAGSQRSYDVRYVVIATGGTSRPRMLGVPGEDFSHVATKMGDPHQYFKKRVLIIGGRNSAAETALRCFHASAYVSLAVRGAELDPQSIKYWIFPELASRLDKGDMRIYYQTDLEEILPDRVVLRHEGKTSEIFADFVIKAIGFEADMSLCLQAGVALSGDNDNPVFDPETLETNIPGIFVAGTVVGGTQRKYRVFIENCHQHVGKIVNALCTRIGINVPSLTLGGGYGFRPDSLGPLEE